MGAGAEEIAWWLHQMENCSRYWPFVRGIHRSPVDSLHKGQWRGALVFSLIYAWINAWVNNREALNLRRHRAHCDATVMRKIIIKTVWLLVNTLRPRQNGRHFPNDIFKRIFLNEDVWISLNISLKFVPKARGNNVPALVQIMALRRPGDKPLSDPMTLSSPTHICINWRIYASLGLNELNTAI